MFMTYLMSHVLCLIHLMYFSLMLGRVMLTCDSFALVGWTSTPKGGLINKGEGNIYTKKVNVINDTTVGRSLAKKSAHEL